jgi:DNA-binding PadR family transcriptional regulator
MFRRFAYQFSGPSDPDGPEGWGPGWTPPWLEDAWHRLPPHIARFLHMRRMGGFGGPFGRGGRGGPFNPGDGGRFFGRGDVKFALLALLRERPMYGYEMIKALEEKSGGFYTPSPGSIYPTLQMLEERGFVTSQELEGKKVYSITDTGRALLEEHQHQEQFAGPPWMRHHREHEERHQGPRPEMQALRAEAMEVARLFAIAGRGAFHDPAQMTRLRGIIERTRKELTEMIYGGSASEEPVAPPKASDAE